MLNKQESSYYVTFQNSSDCSCLNLGIETKLQWLEILGWIVETNKSLLSVYPLASLFNYQFSHPEKMIGKKKYKQREWEWAKGKITSEDKVY